MIFYFFLLFQDIHDEFLPEKSTLVWCHKLRDTIKKLVKSRGVKAPHLSIGIDGGQDKILITLQCYDLANDSDEDSDPDYKEGGRRRCLVIGRADYCPESRQNIGMSLCHNRL